MVPHLTFMTVAAILRSRLEKWLIKETFIYLFVTEFKLQLRLSMQALQKVNTSNGIKI